MKNKKILLIENNPSQLEKAERLLTAAGAKVVTARNANDTINAYSNCNPCFDLVIVDVDLPDVTGTSLSEFIRARAPKVPIILTTAFGRLPVIVETANRIGARVISSPLKGEELVTLARAEMNCRTEAVPQTAEESKAPFAIRHILKVASNAVNLKTV